VPLLTCRACPAAALQDHDGSHIKGLIMNFLHTFYPSLLKVPGFLVEFITPIIKVSVKTGSLVIFSHPPHSAPNGGVHYTIIKVGANMGLLAEIA
jgi:hypothetical protein